MRTDAPASASLSGSSLPSKIDAGLNEYRQLLVAVAVGGLIGADF